LRFAEPYVLALLLVIPVLLFLKSRLGRREDGAMFSDVGLVAGFGRTRRIRYRWAPTALRAVALALVVTALARPQTGRANTEIPAQGIDIALVLDTSSSMSSSLLGKDSRSAVAGRVLTSFIAGRHDDRIGLVIFRNESLVLSPLTLDYEALTRLVAGAQDVNLDDGTAIGLGLSEGVNLLRESKARSRVAVLLTDGENNNPVIEPVTAAKIAATLGIKVYTIGVLDAAARPGQAANVDEQALRQMADLTGGKFFEATSAAALSSVYQNIDKLEKSRIGRPQFAAYHELAVYFLAGALALVVMEQLANATVWRRAL
jgi:Ca-activated chloride channel homolog